jgi:hypothetical protein
MSIFLNSISYALSVSGSSQERRNDGEHTVYDTVAVKEVESLRCVAVRTGLFGTTGEQDLQHGFYEEKDFANVGEIW